MIHPLSRDIDPNIDERLAAYHEALLANQPVPAGSDDAALAGPGVEVDQAVAALTATASHMAGRTSEEDEQQALFVAEMRQVVRRLLRYVRLSS